MLQPCFLRTRAHIKCLVSYLGSLTAPLCPSKTASGLVQTLSGNNRWLLYCLRSFTLEEQLLKQTPLDRMRPLVNVPLGNANWNGTALYPATVWFGTLNNVLFETPVKRESSSVKVKTQTFKEITNLLLWKQWNSFTEQSVIWNYLSWYLMPYSHTCAI